MGCRVRSVGPLPKKTLSGAVELKCNSWFRPIRITSKRPYTPLKQIEPDYIWMSVLGVALEFEAPESFFTVYPRRGQARKGADIASAQADEDSAG